VVVMMTVVVVVGDGKREHDVVRQLMMRARAVP